MMIWVSEAPKQKFARNIEAIRTLFQLEQEHRGATAEEQQVLSQYVGWGGLADAFDPGKDSWAKEYAELKGLLSEDEYCRRPFQHPERPLHQPHRDPWHLRCCGAHGFP